MKQGATQSDGHQLWFIAAFAFGLHGRTLAQWTAIDLNGSGLTSSQVNAVVPGMQAGSALGFGNGDHAILWSGSSSGWMDLTPTGASADVYGMTPTQQVGSFRVPAGLHAAIWSGSPQTLIDLGFAAGRTGASLNATDGQEQVGRADTAAYLWHGTAGSAVSLHPAGAALSNALAVADGHEGGWIQLTNGSGPYHAALWSGSAASFVDMNGAFLESQVLGMAAGQQVGWARPFGAGGPYAIVWNGTAASAVNFNPPGAGTSTLWATCGSAQAGSAPFAGFGGDAGIWFGTPGSFVDLAAFLPAGMFYNSAATCIAEQNGVYYVGGYASPAAGGGNHAFLWIGVPSPGAGMILALGCAVFAHRHRRSRRAVHTATGTQRGHDGPSGLGV